MFTDKIITINIRTDKKYLSKHLFTREWVESCFVRLDFLATDTNFHDNFVCVHLCLFTRLIFQANRFLRNPVDKALT